VRRLEHDDCSLSPSVRRQPAPRADHGNVATCCEGSLASTQLFRDFRHNLALLADLHVRPVLQAKFDASDIVQETCLQATQSFDQFRGSSEGQLAPGLRQIMFVVEWASCTKRNNFRSVGAWR